MATEKFNKLIKIDINSQSLGELNKSISEIDKEIKNIQENEIKVNQSLEEQAEVLKRINALEQKKLEISVQQEKLTQAALSNGEKAALQAEKQAEEEKKLEEQKKKAAEKTAKALEAQQQRAEKLFKVAEGVGGAFQVAAGAQLIFGEQTSEALAQAQAKVVAIISATDGIKKVAEGASNGFKLISKGIKSSEEASDKFGKTTKSSLGPILLIGLALSAIVVYFDEIVEVAKEFADAIGLTPVIEQVQEFVDKIGGLPGLLTVVGGAFKGFVKEVVNVFEIIASGIKGLFTLNFDDFKKNISEIGKSIAEETNKAIEKAEDEARFQKLLKEKENAIKIKDQEIAINKAKGKDTLKLEEENIRARIELDNLRLTRIKKNSKEELELKEKLFQDQLALEANLKAQADKEFERRLKRIEDNALKEIAILNKRDKTEVISAEEKASELLLIEQKRLDAEIKLRQRRGEDVQNLITQKSQLELDVINAANAEILSNLDKNNLKVLKLQQEKYLQGGLKAEEYQKFLKELEIKGLEDRLSVVKDGSKEELDLITQINDKKIALKDFEFTKDKEIADKKRALEDYLLQKRIDDENAILNNTKKSIKERLDANEEVNALLLEQNDKALEEAKKKFGEESVEYQKLADQKIKIEEDFQKKRGDLIREAIEKDLQAAQQVLAGLSKINELANTITDLKVQESEAKISEIEERNAEIDGEIEEINSAAEESSARIQELEGNLSTARGERADVLRKQIEDERKNRADLLRQQNEETKRKIENEKKIEAEKKKIEKLEKERKERERVLAIGNAIVNTALGVTQALALAPPLSFILAAAVGVAGAAEVATIASQKYADGGLLDGPSHNQGGIKGTGRFSNVEVEGGEFIVNKRSTAKYLPLLEALNGGPGSSNTSFADGGTLPNYTTINNITQTTNEALRETTERPIYVSVQEINDVSTRVKAIEDSSEF